ncbi:unnamed protein product [Clonostachys solani]|uniref:Uncharacterized protein n=1 Tax=Clonostachys solani TaxID=160281 RepID=A0A9N9ZI06_9HYPO|nr:unnamed protein product [Clonostachys solani]
MTAKVALVTASSAGLGAAIAYALITSYRVVINYNSRPQHAEAVLQQLRHLSAAAGIPSDDGEPRAVAIQANVTQAADTHRLVAETVAKMGRLDAVISNVGWTHIRDFSNLDDNLEEDDWDSCFTANVKSHLSLLQASREHLDKTHGSFITIASVAGVKPSGSSLPYAVTKAAQIYMVKCLAGMVGPNIRINSVSPGILMTDVADQVKCLLQNLSITGVNVVIDSGFSST